MAKMFYTLDEAATHLGVTQDQIKEMVASGQLQQFRDRDKLMFKRDQIDALASGGGDQTDIEDVDDTIDLADSSAGTAMGSSGPIALADSGDTDAISLAGDTAAGQTAGGTAGLTGGGTDIREATGVSVFEADEIEVADPMAQTQVTSNHPEDEELALESVGSGSGLLDLTRESDDTSLGAELLDEIYPGGEASDANLDSAVGSSGVFESALGTEMGQTGASGLTHLEGTAAPVAAAPTVAAVPTTYEAESVDPAWNGAAAGLMLAATVALILGLLVIAGAIAGTAGGITATLASFGSLVVLGGLALLALILWGIGFFVGKAAR